MIYLYDSTETDFRYNGKPLPTAYDVTVSNTLNGEYYVLGKLPLDQGKAYKEIVEDRIIKVHTMDGMQPFRIVKVSKHELYVEFEAWPLFYADMRDKLIRPFKLEQADGHRAMYVFSNALLTETPFRFYSEHISLHDYQVQSDDEMDNNPNQLYNALDVFKEIVTTWNSEVLIRGYDVRLNTRIGRDTEALLYEKKNITEFVDTTNIEGIVTRLHGKSEWTSQEHVDSGSGTVIPTDPSERPAAAYKGNAGFSKLDVGDPVTIRSGMQYFLTFRTEKNPETNRDKTYYYQIPIKKDHTGYKDEIVEVKTGVSVGTSYNAYYLKNLQKWVLAQDIVESYGKEGVSYEIKTTVDSPLINNYSGIVFEKQYTNNDIQTEQELKDWLNLKFTTENIDKPQRTIEVGTNQIGTDELTIGDTLILKYTQHDVDMRIKVIGYEYDGFADKTKKIILGQPKQTSGSTIGNTIVDLIDGAVEEIDKEIVKVQTSANGKNRNFYGIADPNTLDLDAQENDAYFRSNGDEKELWIFTGTVWELVLDTSDTTKNAREIEAVIEQAEADRAELEEEIGSSLSLAKAHAEAEDARIRGEIESEIGGAIDLAEQAKQDAIDKANQAYEDAVTEADRLAAIRDDGITIEAGQITAGVIDAARLDAVSIVTSGLTTNVIKSTHLETSTATIDKLFASDAAVNRLTAKTAFINSVKAVEIDAARITSGTINTARLNATSIVTQGLTTNVIKSTHIESSNLLVDKIFSTSAYIDRLTSKAAFISDIKAIEISADKITTGELNAANVRIINLDVANISGFSSTFIQSRWNGINSSVQINYNGLEMMGSAAWRRNIMNATGIELFNGSGGYRLAGTIGYFKGRVADAIGDESVINVGTGKHYIGIAANPTHDVAIGYNSSDFNNRNYNSAIRVRGEDGNIYFDKQMFVTGTSTHLHMGGNHIREVQQVRLQGPNTTQRIGIFNNGSDDQIYVQGWGGVKLGDRRSDTSYATHFHVTQNGIHSFVSLNMNGNGITNQSDIRLKRNIEDSSLDALREIERLKFIEYDWDKEKSINEGKPTERQFGIVAQYSPFLQTKAGESESYLSVDLTKQINLNSKAAQELLNYTRKLEERIEVLENERTA